MIYKELFQGSFLQFREGTLTTPTHHRNHGRCVGAMQPMSCGTGAGVLGWRKTESLMKRIALAFTLASSPVLAEITPADVIESWRTVYAGSGATITYDEAVLRPEA